MKKPFLYFALCSILTGMLMTSCGTSKNSSRKCDGRRATQTPMGKM